MPRIDVDAVEGKSGTNYPSPHDEQVKARRWKPLGGASGLTQFGVNLVTLEPGVWSSQRHWHSHEDEFVYVLEGAPTLVSDQGAELLGPGDCAGFPAGAKDGHMFKNLSDKPVRLLVVGTRDDRDHGEYPDIDMRFNAGRYSGKSPRFSRKDGSEIG